MEFPATLTVAPANNEVGQDYLVEDQSVMVVASAINDVEPDHHVGTQIERDIVSATSDAVLAQSGEDHENANAIGREHQKKGRERSTN